MGLCLSQCLRGGWISSIVDSAIGDEPDLNLNLKSRKLICKDDIQLNIVHHNRNRAGHLLQGTVHIPAICL